MSDLQFLVISTFLLAIGLGVVEIIDHLKEQGKTKTRRTDPRPPQRVGCRCTPVLKKGDDDE
jgi:hypothetical protein